MSLVSQASIIYAGVIVPTCVIIPLIPAVKNFVFLPSELRIICVYLFVSALVSLINTFLGLSNVNNMPIAHVYTLLEYILLALFYRKVFANMALAKWISYSTYGFAFVCIVNAVFFQSIHTYNSYTKSIESIIIVGLSIAYFKKLLDEGKTADRFRWTALVNSGLLTYYASSMALFTITNLISGDFAFKVLWSIHATLLLILYILIAIALWKYKAPATT